MRDIKFRGLMEIESTKKQQWIYYSVGTKPTLVGAHWIAEDLQYTGLKDKNGKDGYQNDLVKYGMAIYQIVWSDFDAGFYIVHVAGTGWNSGLPIHNLTNSTIIGNVFENPELLEVKE
jgi:hypothetical protein